ncbi:MAG: serine/threonine-protein kinase [Acidobacteriota bacterium]
MALSPHQIETLSKLLDVALELEPTQRETWIASLPPDEQALAEPLREMLANDDKLAAEQRFDQLPKMSQNEEVATRGEVVGPYRLLHEIGRGGMGSVWLAERSDGSFKRQVALKLPRLAWGAGLAERMAREREIGALLEHPAIGRMYDAGVDERGRPYLAFEYIDGQPIDAWCQSQALSLRQRLTLFLQVIKAVAYAHGRLVVHRDLKPSNVLVTQDGQAHLLDFGIAKLLQDVAQADANLTREQGLVLTPHYASPEQIAGEPITVASDVYSLGVLLYELLTGVLPFAPRRETLAAIEEAVLQGDIVLASTRVKDKATARALRGELDAILTKAMQRDPQRRYATADALAQDIQRHLQGETVSARPDSLGYRLRKGLRRHWVGVSAATAVLIAVLSGTAVALLQARRAERSTVEAQQASSRAERARGAADAELRYAEAANEMMTFLLGERGSKPFTAIEMMARAETLVEHQFAEEPALRAKFQRLLAIMYDDAEEGEKASALVGRAQASAKGLHDLGLQSYIECGRAYIESDRGTYDQSMATFNSVIAALEINPTDDSTILATCLQYRSEIKRRMGNPKGALEDATKAVQVLPSPRPGQRKLAITLRVNVADARFATGQFALGLQEYESVLKQFQWMGRDRSMEYIVVLNNLGVRLDSAGQLRRAGDVFTQALDLMRGLGGTQAVLPTIETNVANSLRKRGRDRQAQQLFDSALANATRAGDPMQAAQINLSAARSWCSVGDFSGCRHRIDAARQALQKLLPAGHPLMGMVDAADFDYYWARQDYRNANTFAQRAWLKVNAAKSDRSDRIIALSNLAQSESKLQQWDQANAHAQEAVTLAREMQSGLPYNYWLGLALSKLGSIQLDHGERAAATINLREAELHLRETLYEDSKMLRNIQEQLRSLP